MQNPEIQTLFKNRIGDKISKAVYNTKDYPNTSIISNLICLDYQLKERCFKGETYNYAKSYTFIPNNIFKKFMCWARKLIQKNNLEGR